MYMYYLIFSQSNQLSSKYPFFRQPEQITISFFEISKTAIIFTQESSMCIMNEIIRNLKVIY